VQFGHRKELLSEDARCGALAPELLETGLELISELGKLLGRLLPQALDLLLGDEELVGN
jgi:hypothetical protein